MRNLIEGILLQAFTDQKQQVESTNWAVKKQIKETRDSKGKLEEHLSLVWFQFVWYMSIKVFKEISDMEDNIAEIKKALCEISKSVAITGTRQSLRDCRPAIEYCRDSPHHRYVFFTTIK